MIYYNEYIIEFLMVKELIEFEKLLNIIIIFYDMNPKAWQP